MKKTHYFILSIAASFGFATMMVSFLAAVQTIREYVRQEISGGLWDAYMKSFNRYQEYELYFSAMAFIFLLLFLVLQVHKKHLRS